MSPEKTYYQHLWWVLTKIKRESLSTPKGKPIEYEFSHIVASGVPNSKTEQNILEQLDQEGAIHIYELQPADWRGGRGWCHLEIFDITFKKIYEETEKVINGENPTSEGNKSESVKVTDNTAGTYGEKRERLWKLLEQLRSRHDGFVDLPEREYFLGIADYIKFIVETPELEKIAQAIKKEEAEDEKKVADLEKAVLEEVEATAKHLAEVISGNNLDRNEAIKKAYQAYVDVKEGRIQSSASLPEALWGELTRVVDLIREQDQKELVKDYIKVDPDSGYITEFTFSPHYDDYLEELKKFRAKRETTTWGSWDSLVLVYLVVHKFDEEIKNLDPYKDVWRRMNFIGIHGEMQEILKERHKPRIQFEQDKYKIHLNRVHSFFTQRLEEDIPVLQIVKQAQEEARRTITAFPFPQIPQIDTSLYQIPEVVLKATAGTAQLTDQLVKAQESFKALGVAVQNAKNSMIIPNLTGMVLPPSSIQKQLTYEVDQSQELLDSSPPEPKSFTDDSYRELAKQAEDQRVKMEAMEAEMNELKALVARKAQGKMTKTRAIRELRRLRKTIDFGDMEFAMLEAMADLEKWSLKKLTNKVKTKDCKHLKKEVKEKLDGTDWTIISHRSYKLDEDSFYQLIYLPDQNSN